MVFLVAGNVKAVRAIMAKKKSAKFADRAVETIRHKDKRKNIPTEELRDLHRDEPGTVHLAT